MPQRLFDGPVVPEKRSGWKVLCSRCNTQTPYTLLNIIPPEDVYLYCDSCSNFVLRDEDRQALKAHLTSLEGDEFEAQADLFYERLEATLPKCDCGGKFSLWSNAKCNHCSFEFPYNNGVKNKLVRYGESKLVWIEGAIAYRGASLPSNLVEIITRP
jgi:hypothetical protein